MNMQLAEELRKLEQMMSVQLGCEELREAELKMEVSICEVEQSEAIGTDEEWRSMEEVMNHCEDLRQQEVCLSEEEIIDDFLSYWVSPDQLDDVKPCVF